MKRPFGVTVIAALVLLSALFDLATGIWMMLAPLGANPTVTDLAGNSQEIPGFFLFINGLLSIVRFDCSDLSLLNFGELIFQN